MYRLPDVQGVRKCVITADVVKRGSAPLLEVSDTPSVRASS